MNDIFILVKQFRSFQHWGFGCFQKVQLTLLLSTWYPWLLRSPLNSVVWKLLTAGCVRGMKRTCSGMAAGWAGWAGRAGAWVGRLTLRGCCWGLLALGLHISDVSICLTTISKLSNYPRIYISLALKSAKQQIIKLLALDHQFFV